MQKKSMLYGRGSVNMQQRPELSQDGHLLPEAQLKKIAQAIASLKFGSVTITVQDGRIVQIEKIEKFRV
jgi:hypothetical protein